MVSVCGENYTATQFDSFSNFDRREVWVNGYELYRGFYFFLESFLFFFYRTRALRSGEAIEHLVGQYRRRTAAGGSPLLSSYCSARFGVWRCAFVQFWYWCFIILSWYLYWYNVFLVFGSKCSFRKEGRGGCAVCALWVLMRDARLYSWCSLLVDYV